MTRLSSVNCRLAIASVRTTCARARIAFGAGAVTCLSATPAFAATCESLAAVALKDAKITSAQVVPAEGSKVNAGNARDSRAAADAR